MCVCMGVCGIFVRECMCTVIHACACTRRSQALSSGVRPCHFPPYILRHSSLNLELTKTIILAGQGAFGVFLSLPFRIGVTIIGHQINEQEHKLDKWKTTITLKDFKLEGEGRAGLSLRPGVWDSRKAQGVLHC